MSLSKEEIEKLHEIRKTLHLTFKSSVNGTQRLRLKKDLDELDGIIQDINDGKWVNPAKVKLFSKSRKNNDEETELKNDNIEENYSLVAVKKIAEHINVQEIDIIYSYFYFFDENFYQVLSTRNLKLRFEAGKKRDEILSDYDYITRLLEQYKSDILTGAKVKEVNLSRLNIERFTLFTKLSDFFKSLLELVEEINKGISSGEKIALNPDEDFFDNHDISNYGLFEGKKIKDILIQLEVFIRIYLTKINIPDFIKGKK